MAILNCAWRKKFAVLAILSVSVALAGYTYRSRTSYTSKGMLLVQRAQNSSIQEISAGLGRMSAERFGSLSKDLYVEKFLMYLNSRDFFLETAEALLFHPQFDEHAKYLSSDRDGDGDEEHQISSIASTISVMSSIAKSGSLGLEIAVKAKSAQSAVFLTEILMKQANIFIVSRELKELNASKDYLKSNLAGIESGLADLFNQHVEAIRKNPKIQEASKKILLEKISAATIELEKLRMEIKSNDLLLQTLRKAERLETGKIIDRKTGVGSHFDRSVDELKAHVSALIKKRDSYLSAGMAKDSTFVSDLENEIEAASKSFLEMNSHAEKAFALSDVPVLSQIKFLQRENLIKSQMQSSLQEQLQGIFKDGIDHATYEQNSNDLIRRAEIQYTLFAELTKQLFAIDVQTISVQNKVMAIERPAIETVERQPAFLTTIFLGIIFAFAVSYVYLLQVDRDDPVISSADDLAAIGAKVFGFVPPLRMRSWARKGRVEKIDHSVDSSASIIFKNIRSKIIRRHFDGGKPCRVVMVTSSRSEEGKSFFSVNLAQSIARAGLKTLAIDIDTRSQGLTKSFAQTEETGLIEYLLGSKELTKSIYNISECLDVLPAGKFNHSASELLLSNKMLDMLVELGKQYEIIVIDSAPILIVGDAFNMLSAMDEVIVMARAGVTRFEELARALDQVAEGGASGQVILNMSGSLGSYYYGQKTVKRSFADKKSDLQSTG